MFEFYKKKCQNCYYYLNTENCLCCINNVTKQLPNSEYATNMVNLSYPVWVDSFTDQKKSIYSSNKKKKKNAKSRSKFAREYKSKLRLRFKERLTRKNKGNPEEGFWNMAIFGLKGWDGYGLNFQTQVLEREWIDDGKKRE